MEKKFIRPLGFRHNDGGRNAAGYKGETRDCVVRSIAIATELPYQKVYDKLFDLNRAFAASHRSRAARWLAKNPSPRSGNMRKVYEPWLRSLGWIWTPTMRIGQGCTVHLLRDELPAGRLIVYVSRHLTAVIDGEIHDTSDPSRDGTRCVYGFYSKEEDQ